MDLYAAVRLLWIRDLGENGRELVEEERPFSAIRTLYLSRREFIRELELETDDIGKCRRKLAEHLGYV